MPVPNAVFLSAHSGKEAKVSSFTDVLCDRHGRVVDYIRISLTERCNFACPFCVPPDTGICHESEHLLSREEILRLCELLSKLGIRNFKITGGEPLLHPDAISILKTVKCFSGVDSVTITTNGSTLHHHAELLGKAGVDCINVSLNAFTAETYRQSTGSACELSGILDNILLTKRLGINIKLNMVPIRGLNDDDFIPALEFALSHDIFLRFIELMPLGQGRLYTGVPRSEVLEAIERRFGRPKPCAERFGNGPATYYSLERYRAKIGYIAAVSEQFCSTCNRIRLSSTGFLKTCLHHNHGIDLGVFIRSEADDETIQDMICLAVSGKPAGHEFYHESLDELGATPMYRIGG